MEEEGGSWMRRKQGNFAFSLVPGSKLLLHLCENLPGNMDMVVGASGYTAIQIFTSVYLKIL